MKMLMFDMDGTLINSGSMIANTINHVRTNIGFHAMEKDYILQCVNDPKINAAEFFYGTEHFTDEQTVLFEEYYNEHCLTDLEIYDGMTELLEELKGEFHLTVATNASSDFAKKMLNHLDLGKFFQSVVGYNDVTNPKPHPEMIYKLLDTHNIKKENSQLIGDSHKDIMAANNAGVDSVLVNWGFSNHEVDAIETMDELRKEIEKKFS